MTPLRAWDWAGLLETVTPIIFLIGFGLLWIAIGGVLLFWLFAWALGA